MSTKRQFGDYQTPPGFALKVCLYLKEQRGLKPAVILEPSCGTGAFLKSSLIFGASQYLGVEINPAYCAECRQNLNDARVKIITADIFSLNLQTLTGELSPLLILGNPPWITGSTLTAINAENTAPKSNFKRLKGLDAITGAGNFDLCEAIILKLVNAYRDTDPVIAMLCKTAVARNVFMELERAQVNYRACDMLEFDAFKVFGISAAACLLVIELGKSAAPAHVLRMFDFDRPDREKARLTRENDRLCRVSLQNAPDFDGYCQFEWRQGIKHDCAKVMELNFKEGRLLNGLQESVQIENNLVFPLIKSSMFKTPVINSFSKYVPVPQKKPGQDTKWIKEKLPQTWAYLNAHKELFDRRKSIIYRGAPPFAVFGVGEYSFAKYKVGVSGFYKKPLFALLYSNDGRPVMTDDTAYFIPFDSYDLAYCAMLLLNSEKVQSFLLSIAFTDAKRPFTKKVLNRLDFAKITAALSFEELIRTETGLKLPAYMTADMYENFKQPLK